MSESESPLTTSLAYLSLKLAKAPKAGARAMGFVHYRVLTDADRQLLYLTLVGNDSSGCYSKEIVPFAHIERCLLDVDTSKPITSKVFRSAFVSKSQNNAGFLAAVLRAEQLIGSTADANHQHCVLPGWDDWKRKQLDTAETTEPFVPEQPKPRGTVSKSATKLPASESTEVTTATMLPTTPTKVPGIATIDTDTSTIATIEQNDINVDAGEELDDTELELLQRSVGISDDLSHEDDGATVDSVIPQVVEKRSNKRQPREKLQLPTGRSIQP